MLSEDKYIEDIDIHGTAADMWEFSLKGCEIVSKLSLDEVMKIIEQNNGYHTVRVKLSDEMVDKMKKLEERINDLLHTLFIGDFDEVKTRTRKRGFCRDMCEHCLSQDPHSNG